MSLIKVYILPNNCERIITLYSVNISLSITNLLLLQIVWFYGNFVYIYITSGTMQMQYTRKVYSLLLVESIYVRFVFRTCQACVVSPNIK